MRANKNQGMYAFLKGKLARIEPTHVHMEVNGVGYLVHISLHTYSQIEQKEECSLFTHLYVKEDALTLFGFFEEEEKNLFVLLISVSGIGPNTARIILSSMVPSEVKTAILTENDLAFKKVKGVGPKTAKRLILDLKDKIKEGAALAQNVPVQTISSQDRAISALVALGFQKQKVVKVLQKIDVTEGASTEETIKIALQHLT